MTRLRVEITTANLPSDEAYVHVLPMDSNLLDAVENILVAVETLYNHLEVIGILFMMEEDPE